MSGFAAPRYVYREITQLLKSGTVTPRKFHSSPHVASQPSPKVLRKKKALEQMRSANIVVDRKYDSEESLPPMHLLRVAKDSGALTSEPEKILEFLRRYQNHVLWKSPGWEARLCSEFGITIETVTIIGAILRRCKTKAQRALARSLMLSASALGDKSATFEIVSSALRLNLIHSHREPLARLENFAKKGDQQSMMLMGKVLFHAQKEKDALFWLQQATQQPAGNLEFDGAGEALVLEGRILLKLNDHSGARAVFEKSAKQLDDPQAYLYLSSMDEESCSNQLDYLLKAATMGIPEACHRLGLIELMKIQENSPPKKMEGYGLAMEWFLVAANDRYGPSMLKLATMCRTTGCITEADKWSKKAAEVLPGLASPEK